MLLQAFVDKTDLLMVLKLDWFMSLLGQPLTEVFYFLLLGLETHVSILMSYQKVKILMILLVRLVLNLTSKNMRLLDHLMIMSIQKAAGHSAGEWFFIQPLSLLVETWPIKRP
eukprot:Lithocolla_globosa_v1_NODE_4602_length_1403_cov_3.786350.p2 type:complete len:113 gc:universal NODE_4602_length_1403_cov_3.786350:830-1168(+)